MNDMLGTPESRTALIERAKAILIRPKEEWPKIADESTSIGDLLKTYVAPLIVIGPIALLIGSQLFGIDVFIGTFRPSLSSSLATAVTGVVMALISLAVVTIIAEVLAPSFGGEANRRQAFKLVAYAMTSVWVAGIVNVIPALGVIGLLAAIYSLYLLYLGVTPLMKVPQDKVPVYTAVVVLGAIVASFVTGRIAIAFSGLLGASLPSPYLT